MPRHPFLQRLCTRALCGGTAIVLLAPAASVGAGFSPHNSPSSPSGVPAWAREAVWYQIFPERFRNGDRSNDPAARDLTGAWPYHVPERWGVSPWTSDWYKLQPWESADTLGFYHHVQQRRYGGDLQGVIDKLDYLADLGVNALYFNPLFESPSLHKYDASLYHHIDNNFGPDPEGDRRIWREEDPSDPGTWRWTAADTLFLGLVRAAHARGMKVIVDGVFNHVGRTFWALEDVRREGKESRFKDWFMIHAWDDPATARDEFDYQGWQGIRELPEFREDDSGLVAGPREHVRAVVRRWMDPDGDGSPADGIDGWRLDVAERVGLPFWREFRRWVRGLNPEAYITGEVWWQDWNAQTMFNAAPWLAGDAFDAVMNYRLAREACHFFIDKQKKISPAEFDRRLRGLRSDYRPEATAVLMNILGSHDTDRIGSMIVNADNDYDHRAGATDNRSYDVRKPHEDELLTRKLMALFQMTYTGAPMVYYGDEAGMWGGDDPDNRKPMLWKELRYDNEASHPFGTTRPDDPNVFNDELFACYRDAIRLRRATPALVHGDFSLITADSAADVFAYARTFRGSRVAVVFNNGRDPYSLTLPLQERARSWNVIYPPGAATGDVDGAALRIPAKSGLVLEAQRR
jgi:glycosidase